MRNTYDYKSNERSKKIKIKRIKKMKENYTTGDEYAKQTISVAWEQRGHLVKYRQR